MDAPNEYSDRDDSFELSGSFGLSSFNAGSFYVSAGIEITDVDSDTILGFGFAKDSLEELSYDIGIINTHGDSNFGLSLRFPLDNGAGVRVGVADIDKGSVMSVGYDFNY